MIKELNGPLILLLLKQPLEQPGRLLHYSRLPTPRAVHISGNLSHPTLFIAELWKLNGMVRKTTYVWALTLMFASMVTFPAMNNVYKQTHYYPYNPIAIRDAFTGKFNRFAPSDKPPLPPDESKYLCAIDWQKQEQPVEVPKHLLWVVIECSGLKYPNTYFDNNQQVVTYNMSRSMITPASYLK